MRQPREKPVLDPGREYVRTVGVGADRIKRQYSNGMLGRDRARGTPFVPREDDQRSRQQSDDDEVQPAPGEVRDRLARFDIFFESDAFGR